MTSVVQAAGGNALSMGDVPSKTANHILKMDKGKFTCIS